MEGHSVEIACNLVTDTPQTISTPTIPTQPPLADSGATDSIFRVSDVSLLTHITPNGGAQVTYPDGTTVIAIGSGVYKGGDNIPLIPVKIFEDSDLRQSLIATDAYTRQGLAVIFTDDALRYVTKSSFDNVLPDLDVKYMATKKIRDKLWTAPKATTDIINVQASNIVHNEIDANFTGWWHATLGSPPISSLLGAITRGALRNIPRLTTKIVRRNLPHTMATAMGHLDLTRAHLKSTNPSRRVKANNTNVADTIREQNYDDPTEWIDYDERIHDNQIYTKYGPDDEQSKHDENTARTIHTDATGRYPIRSSKGNEYIMTSVYNGFIYMVPMKNRSKEQIIKAYEMTHDYFLQYGHNPKFQRLDNETSSDLEQWFKDRRIPYQYCDKDSHRRNLAERAIRDAKNHIVATLATAHPECPKNLWDECIPQCIITLNLLRRWKQEPTLSAYEGFYGTTYDFDAHPIAPFGTKVMIYESPEQRKTWAHHGVQGYYLGPQDNTYRGYKVWVIGTRHLRDSNTLEWFPSPYHQPLTDARDVLHLSLQQIQRQLMGITQDTSPLHIHEALVHDAIRPLQALITGLLEGTKYYANTDKPTIPTETTAQATPPPQDKQHEHGNDNSRHVPQSRNGQQSESKHEGPISSRTRQQHRWASAQIEGQHTSHQDQNNQTVTTKGGRKTKTIKNDPPQEQQTQHPATSLGDNPQLTVTTPALEDYDLIAPTGMVQVEKHKTRHQKRQRRSHTNSISTDHTWQHRATLTRNNEDHNNINVHATVLDDITGKPLRFGQLRHTKEADIWSKALHGEWIRLGEETKTTKFITPQELPPDRHPTYFNPQPEKKTRDGKVIHRIRGTVGGDKGDPYLEDTAAYIADLTTVKLLLNKVVSTPDARFMTIDITDFYLGTPLTKKQYMRVHRRMIPYDTQTHFNITDARYWYKDHILVEISKGMYGLTEAGILAQERLYEHLGKYGFYLTKNTPGLLRHETRDIIFSLVVDDFGICYTNKADVEFLIEILQKLYKITIDWSGTKYLRMTIDHDFINNTITISMPDYVPKAMKRFGIKEDHKKTYAPGPHMKVQYGKTPQTANIDMSPQISDERRRIIQQVVGVFMYYSRAVDSTMLCETNKLASKQARPTSDVERDTYQLLHYASTKPLAAVTFHRSDMKLRITSDASYNSEQGARSRAAGYFDLINSQDDPYTQPLNGSILVQSQLIDCVVASAAEAEYAALFINGQEGIRLRATLTDLGYPQECTPMFTDNKCAEGLANRSINMKRSKAMDMRYHWTQDQVAQRTYSVAWKEGKDNAADYFTKSHPAAHHKAMRARYLNVKYEQDHLPASSKGVLMESKRSEKGDTNDSSLRDEDDSK